MGNFDIDKTWGNLKRNGFWFPWISFSYWSSSHGRFFSSFRVYRIGVFGNWGWTPFVRVFKRY